MTRVLVPVDGSENSMKALRHVLAGAAGQPLKVVLLNVQPALTRRIGRFVPAAGRDDWRRERAEAATRQARAELDRQGVAWSMRVATGARGTAISQTAQDENCARIVLGTARKHSLTRLLENSVTAQLLEHSPVPVEVVVGPQASAWERWGLPATLGAALATAMAVAD
ncbi:MAG: universal stress protein [Burkholderiales bacterium]|nr:universal stress protein [Burkholderiales bacterium]